MTFLNHGQFLSFRVPSESEKAIQIHSDILIPVLNHGNTIGCLICAHPIHLLPIRQITIARHTKDRLNDVDVEPDEPALSTATQFDRAASRITATKQLECEWRADIDSISSELSEQYRGVGTQCGEYFMFIAMSALISTSSSSLKSISWERAAASPTVCA